MNKFIFIVVIVNAFFILNSCSDEKSNTSVLDNVDTVVDLKPVVEQNSVLCASRILDYEKYDSLSESSLKDSIDKCTIPYYSDYTTLENIDSIFSVLGTLSPLCNQNNSSLRFYVFVKLVQNPNIDGYVGEAVYGLINEFFLECPCDFYESMSFFKKHDVDIYGSFNSYLLFELSNTYEKDSLVKFLDSRSAAFGYKGINEDLKDDI